jgi:uncharacterized membrane protein
MLQLGGQISTRSNTSTHEFKTWWENSHLLEAQQQIIDWHSINDTEYNNEGISGAHQ